MNAWDAFTWLSAALLATSALVIFAFFLRDARSILDREMHGHDEEDENSSTPEGTSESRPSAPPEDLPQ